MIDEPIGRHPTDRIRYAVREYGKEAVTHYRVMERFTRHTLIQVKLETGRTHQIRVHMAHVRFPLVGDTFYPWTVSNAFRLRRMNLKPS